MLLNLNKCKLMNDKELSKECMDLKFRNSSRNKEYIRNIFISLVLGKGVFPIGHTFYSDSQFYS